MIGAPKSVFGKYCSSYFLPNLNHLGRLPPEIIGKESCLKESCGLLFIETKGVLSRLVFIAHCSLRSMLGPAFVFLPLENLDHRLARSNFVGNLLYLKDDQRLPANDIDS